MTRQFNFRFSDDAFEQLEILSASMGLKMADVVRTLVLQAHKRLEPDEIRKIKRRLKEMKGSGA